LPLQLEDRRDRDNISILSKAFRFDKYGNEGLCELFCKRSERRWAIGQAGSDWVGSSENASGPFCVIGANKDANQWLGARRQHIAMVGRCYDSNRFECFFPCVPKQDQRWT
jgi:hypothetical protein